MTLTRTQAVRGRVLARSSVRGKPAVASVSAFLLFAFAGYLFFGSAGAIGGAGVVLAAGYLLS